MFKKLAALVCAVWVAFLPNLALAQTNVVKQNGQLDPLGSNFYGVGYWNGTAWVPAQAGAGGVTKMSEEHPYQLQNDAFPASDTTTTVTNGALKPIGLGWSVSPFGSRNVLITCVQKGTPTTVKLYLFGSDDNVNYYPIVAQDAWGNVATGTPALNGDSLRVDTLGVTIPTLWQGPNTVKQWKLVLPEAVYPGRYVQIWATRTDSTGLTNPRVHLGLRYEGRWK